MNAVLLALSLLPGPVDYMPGTRENFWMPGEYYIPVKRVLIPSPFAKENEAKPKKEVRKLQRPFSELAQTQSITKATTVPSVASTHHKTPAVNGSAWTGWGVPTPIYVPRAMRGGTRRCPAGG